MNSFYQYSGHRYQLRISRSTYLTRGVCFLFGSFIAGLLMSSSSLILMVGGVAMMLLLFVGLFRWVLIPRLHDMGLEPAWAWSLLFLLHSVNFLFLLALLFIPTDAFAKRRHLV